MNIKEFLNGSIGAWVSQRNYVYANGKRKIVRTEFEISRPEEYGEDEVLLQWNSTGDSSSNGEMSIYFAPNGTLHRDRGYFTDESTLGHWEIFENMVMMKNCYNSMEYIETIALVDPVTRIRNTYGRSLKTGQFTLVGNYIEKKLGSEEKIENIYKNTSQSKELPYPIVDVPPTKAFNSQVLCSDYFKVLEKGNYTDEDMETLKNVFRQMVKERDVARVNVANLVKEF